MYDGTSLTDCLVELSKAASIAEGLSELWEFTNSREEDGEVLKAILVMCNRIDDVTQVVRRNVKRCMDGNAL